MRIDGDWYLCQDGVVRPVFRGQVVAADGSSVPAEFLLDTGADRTVLTATVLIALVFTPEENVDAIGGLGGIVESATVETQIRFISTSKLPAVLRGRFVAVTGLDVLDMCVLGRDITDLFAVVVDRPQNVLCLLSPPHHYDVRPA